MFGYPQDESVIKVMYKNSVTVSPNVEAAASAAAPGGEEAQVLEEANPGAEAQD